MPIQINNIILDIDEDIQITRQKAAKILKVSDGDFSDFKILKESIDARKKNEIKFNYQVEVSLKEKHKDKSNTLEKKIAEKARNNNVIFYQEGPLEEIVKGSKKLSNRPVVVGFGPSGMFAALILAENGYRPIVIERGEDVDNRTKTVEDFFKGSSLKRNSNVQFGEGGAGTFSDGKLTTRIKDKRCSYILDRLVSFGAPEEILYMGKPHIGTDNLKVVVKNIRKRIIELGGEVHFNETLEDIVIKGSSLSQDAAGTGSKLNALVLSSGEVTCECAVLAIGHSSRDTYTMLYNKGIPMEAKAFAIGVRVEHLQSFIDNNQYGKYAGHKRLKAADYRLTHTTKEGRGVYSFCMCPGGYVVAASSEEEKLVVNGMSYHSRKGKNANAAIVVSVTPEDFQGKTPLSGMEFQRHYEELAYSLSGSYKAPAQQLKDFMEGRPSSGFLSVEPTYKPGVVLKDIGRCLPEYVTSSLKEGFAAFDRKIKGYAQNDAVLTGIETRTSAPLRIIRNDKFQSLGINGLYLAGEGAGYAGGIISAAVDGVKTAECIMKEYAAIQ